MMAHERDKVVWITKAFIYIFPMASVVATRLEFPSLPSTPSPSLLSLTLQLPVRRSEILAISLEIICLPHNHIPLVIPPSFTPSSS